MNPDSQLTGEPLIRVGIYTDGEPRVSECDSEGRSCHILHNMLIGKDFHWQQTIEARLGGRLERFGGGGDSGITLVNTLPLEEYLRCVAVSEMSPEAPAEFLKAHAIIARSWAIGKTGNAPTPRASEKRNTHDEITGWEDTAAHSGFDVCSDDHCQRYQGEQDIPQPLADAIGRTRGMALTDADGNIADARYSKCCGGVTELFSTCWQDTDPSYLRSFADPHCNLSDMDSEARDLFLRRVMKGYDRNPEPFGRWETTVTKEEIRRNLLTKFGRDIGRIERLVITGRGSSGRACRMLVEGSGGCLTLGKELMIRRLLSPTHLYSSLITLHDRGDAIRLTGRGWGHGVGLCQTGAAHMALKGASCAEILSFYYPTTVLTRIYS